MISTKKIISVLLFYSLVVSANTYINKNNSLNLAAAPQFSDPSLYNSFDFCNSTTGLFETDTFTLKAKLGLQINQLHLSKNYDTLDQQNTTFTAPELFVGIPKTFFLHLRYSPQQITIKNSQSLKLSLPLHTFGLNIAVQIPSEAFKLSVDFNGFAGKEEQTNENGTPQNISYSRTILGTNNLSMTIASRMHPLFLLGMSGGVTAHLDTLTPKLNSSDTAGSVNIRDRYFEGEIPQLSWFLDFGNHEFPVESNFLLSTSTSHFVYVSGLNVDQYPIKSKNIFWKLNTVGNIALSSAKIHPALTLGYWKQDNQVYDTTENNDNLDVGDKRPGNDWNLSDFYFGIASSVVPVPFLSIWCEYTNSSLTLKTGSFFANKNYDDRYHHTRAGLEFRLHDINGLNYPSTINTTLKFGFINSTVNRRINSLSDENYNKAYWATSYSQRFRYQPNDDWNIVRITSFSLGIYSSFLNKMFAIESFVNFPAQSMATEGDGINFKLDLIYNFLSN